MTIAEIVESKQLMRSKQHKKFLQEFSQLTDPRMTAFVYFCGRQAAVP